MQLYFYHKEKSKEHDAEKITTAIDREVKAFRKKFGYMPDGVVVRKDEMNGNVGYARLEVRAVTKGCQPSHFFLFPVVKKRTPRVLEKERKPYV